MKTEKTIKIFAVRNGRTLLRETSDVQEAWKTLREEREGHQRGGTGTRVTVEGISEMDLASLAWWAKQG